MFENEYYESEDDVYGIAATCYNPETKTNSPETIFRSKKPFKIGDTFMLLNSPCKLGWRVVGVYPAFVFRKDMTYKEII
jgi:hypothetical protein